MTQLHYHRAMSAIVNHSLLHLYSVMAVDKRFYPTPKRNEILTKWIKPRVKLGGYAPIKKDLKTLLLVGKRGGNIELKLWDLQRINNEHRAKYTHADHLYIMLSDIYEKAGIQSRMTHIDANPEYGVLYMDQSEIETGFDDDNVQVRPLRAHIYHDQPSVLLALFEENSDHLVASLESSKNGCQEFLLTRKEA